MKIESIAGTLCGIVISVVAILYAKHLGLLTVASLGSCNAKDMLLIGGSVILILYKKILFPRKNNERNDENGR